MLGPSLTAATRPAEVETFDAILLVSFGGPEGPDDVMPFLENVTRGRGVPAERLAEVADHYLQFGGVSPLNAQNRDLLVSLRNELEAQGLDVPIYWGNRNWEPLLTDTVHDMRRDGVRRALAFFTSAYSSYSSCRQYRENLASALVESEAAGTAPFEVQRIGPYFNHPGFITPFIDATAVAIDNLPPHSKLHVLFSTHSIPVSMAAASGAHENAYVRQHREVAELVVAGVNQSTADSGERLEDDDWSLVYQSRSGSPSVPWLEPDIEDRLTELSAEGVDAVVVVPIGFTSDHMEVIWDLDIQAQLRAAECNLAMVRASTPGTDARFVAMIADLVLERLKGIPVSERERLGTLGAAPNRCVAGCCLNPRMPTPLPAVAGDEDNVVPPPESAAP